MLKPGWEAAVLTAAREKAPSLKPRTEPASGIWNSRSWGPPDQHCPNCDAPLVTRDLVNVLILIQQAGWGLRVCVTHKPPRDADAVGHWSLAHL